MESSLLEDMPLTYIPREIVVCSSSLHYNPPKAEATFVESRRTQRFLKNIYTLSSWYSFESSR